MRSASTTTILIGVYFLAMVFAAPTILRWQTEYTLGKYGASEYVDLAISINMEKLALDFAVTKVLAVALLIAGILMRYRRKVGLYVSLCAFFVAGCITIYSFVLGDASGFSLVKALAWAYAFYFVFRANRRNGADWWHISN
jgi:hypothetical protein